MKRNAFVLLVGLWLVGALPAWAGDPAGASQVAIGVTGGSVWYDPNTRIPSDGGNYCIWYLPLVGDLGLDSLFARDSHGVLAYDREHAYLIWVSKFSVEFLPPADLGGGRSLLRVLAPAGEATIYYSDTPETRNFSDPSDQSTWGEPVATFGRKASILRSNDGLATDTFIFSAVLESSSSFKLSGKRFNFADLIPNGMTCFEYGENGSTVEFANCIAIGSAGGAKPAGH
ncbi:MAG: hypothetical protein LAN62_12460 [Acidobacteriia bacterium]|nr:hypothetical protein [Terriglobia bacterium]